MKNASVEGQIQKIPDQAFSEIKSVVFSVKSLALKRLVLNPQYGMSGCYTRCKKLRWCNNTELIATSQGVIYTLTNLLKPRRRGFYKDMAVIWGIRKC